MNAATAAPDRGDWAIASACPVQVSVEIGHTRIPLRVVDSLRAGDVVKIVTPKPCLRASPRVGATLALDNGVFIVSDIPLTSDVPSADSSTAHSSSHSPRTPDAPSSLLLADDLSLDESAPLSVGELPVGLSFSFAPFPMTVAELSSLRPGDVVPLEPGARLLIYANGRQIGRAEMVEVEGALAAEIAVLHLSQREKNA
nr:FliM/FliN family flagellar motor switch protein [Robbsia betulipollinis]